MDHHLLEKYFNGTCTKFERAAVEQWLEQSEELPIVSSNETAAIVQQRALEALNEKINRNKKKQINRRWQWGIAAFILLACVLAMLVSRYGPQGNPALESDIVWETIVIPMGQKAKVTLPDGSIVELNGGSAMSYPKRFVSERTIRLLRGDAFFMVTKNAKHPFVVKTGNNSQIKVLGTHFNVKQNLNASRIEITLNSGKISFERKGKASQLLLPGQQLHFLPASNTISSPVLVDTTETDAWRRNILLFKETPIGQVLNELEQFYGVTFTNGTKDKHQLITAQFENEPLSKILMLLRKSAKLNFIQEGKTIYIHP